MDVALEVGAAERRIRPYIQETPLLASPYFGAPAGAQVYFKLENLQHTGSFKVRGALSKLLSLLVEQQARGVVTASTGNHGAAVAYGLAQLGASGIVFVPETAIATKVDAIARLGATVRTMGRDSAETEAEARRFAEQEGMVYLSPYNDPQVIGGQGTIGLELVRQLDQVDAIFVSVGGGGLISGIAGHLKSVWPDVQVIGCSPENSAVMIQSLKAGALLDLPSQPTLSDGTAGGVEPGAITFDLCRRLVDRTVTVTEDEIAHSLRTFMEIHHMLIEGAAAVAIAAFSRLAAEVPVTFAGKNVVIVLCGANISLQTLKEIL